MSVKTIKRSRKCCLFSRESIAIFLSLVDYRNNLLTSNDPKKIMEFYDGFHSRDELIEWMKERPKGVARIHEVDGDKDIIVVIPTADLNGKYAKECKDNIFYGLHIIFVESGEIPDPYFNYAHNCNVGIKKAMEYNPKWIVISNEDMYKIDEIENLRENLNGLDNRNVDIVFTAPSKYHSTPSILGVPRSIFFHATRIFSRFSKIVNITYLTMKTLRRFNNTIYIARTDFKVNVVNRFLNFLFLRPVKHFTNILSFGIFSSEFVRECKGEVFDEVYIYEMEDTDLSVRLTSTNKKSVVIDFKIGEYVGSSQGTGLMRRIRTVPGLSYFSSKVQMGAIYL